MGTECVRYSPKLSPQISCHKSTESTHLKNHTEMLHFEISISDLKLHCPSHSVGKVVFIVQDHLNLQFDVGQFFILDTMIRSPKTKKASFSVLARNIEFLQFYVAILDRNGTKIQKICLKMHAVCEGPKCHDHLLKQMKARIIYNLEVSQLTTAIFGCEHIKIQDHYGNDFSPSYALTLDMMVPGQESSSSAEKTMIIPGNPEQSEKVTKQHIPAKKLKESIFRVIIYPIKETGFLETSNPLHQICIPYMKFWAQLQDDSSVTSERSGQSIFEIRKLIHSETIKDTTGVPLNILITLSLKVTKIELQQIQCLVFSENGISTVSPYLLSSSYSNINSVKNLNSLKLETFEKVLSKYRKVTYQTKPQIQRVIKQCCSYLSEQQHQSQTSSSHKNRSISKSPALSISPMNKLASSLQSVQLHLLEILNSLTHLITEGQDITNQSIWHLIDKIIHRHELSINYLYLIKQNKDKKEIGLKFYGFISAMLGKIILCTTMGLTYHELKCIQKFIGYVYFRCKWIRNHVLNAIRRPEDPQLVQERLIDIGVCSSNRSPSKSVLYDWEQCLLPYIKNEPKFRELENTLHDTSESVPNWSSCLFSRDNDELYYGLLIEIWTQGQIFLNNNGKILWEYFPNYSDLLSTFLGEMSSNKIIDYSSQFRKCSIKLISNQKLLNNFVMFLFPKTCLYEINCVIKCLELIHSYFSVISKQNKRMPSQFNFNYFYTGIKSIFESNHSYLLIRVIGLLYDHYSIFSSEFKSSLDHYVFGKGFWNIFLHWSDHVRRIFFLFLEHRLTKKFRDIDSCEPWQNKNISFEMIERKNKYLRLMQQLKTSEQEIQRTRCNIKPQKNTYYLKMKDQLKIKKQQKQQKLETSFQDTFLLQKETIQSPQRKQSQSPESIVHLLKIDRRWSMEDVEETVEGISEDGRKYLLRAMEEYREVLTVKDPDFEVQKVLGRLKGNQSVDI